MQISQLIKRLEELRRAVGDVRVVTNDDEDVEGVDVDTYPNGERVVVIL